MKPLKQLTEMLRENLPVAAVEVKLILCFVLAHIIITIPTLFQYSNSDVSWIIELISFSLKLILWGIIPILLFPKVKIFWLLFVLNFLNIPNSISDIVYVDKYDNFFIMIKLIILIPILFLTLKGLFKNETN